jgi:hypothetical protein
MKNTFQIAERSLYRKYHDCIYANFNFDPGRCDSCSDYCKCEDRKKIEKIIDYGNDNEKQK